MMRWFKRFACTRRTSFNPVVGPIYYRLISVFYVVFYKFTVRKGISIICAFPLLVLMNLQSAWYMRGWFLVRPVPIDFLMIGDIITTFWLYPVLLSCHFYFPIVIITPVSITWQKTRLFVPRAQHVFCTYLLRFLLPFAASLSLTHTFVWFTWLNLDLN